MVVEPSNRVMSLIQLSGSNALAPAASGGSSSKLSSSKLPPPVNLSAPVSSSCCGRSASSYGPQPTTTDSTPAGYSFAGYSFAATDDAHTLDATSATRGCIARSSSLTKGNSATPTHSNASLHFLSSPSCTAPGVLTVVPLASQEHCTHAHTNSTCVAVRPINSNSAQSSVVRVLVQVYVCECV